MSQKKLGAVLSYVAIFINLGIALFFTPYLVKTLGKNDYGLFTMIGGLIANLVVLEFGLNDTVVKFVSQFRAKEDKDGERNFLAVMTLIYLVIATLVLTGGACLYFFLPSIFGKGLTAAEIETARTMLLILTGVTAATMFFNCISGSLVAYERFIFVRTLDLISIVGSMVASLVVLMMGYGVIGLTIVTGGMALCLLMARVFYAFAVLKIRPKLIKFEWKQVKEIFLFSGAVFIVIIVEQVYWRVDSAVLGATLGTAAVAVYSIGVTFSKHFMRFGTALSKLMMPSIVSKVEKGASPAELTDVLTSISRLQAIMLYPVLIGLIIFGRDFISLWVGPAFQDAYWVMLLTLIPYSVELTGNVRNQIMQAKGIYWLRSKVIIVVAMVKLAATFAAIPLFGIIGAAATTGLGLVVGYIWINQLLKQKIGLEIARHRREVLHGLAPALGLAAGIGALTLFIPADTWSGLLIRIAIFTLAAIPCLWLVGMNDTERTLFKSLVPKRFRRQAKASDSAPG